MRYIRRFLLCLALVIVLAALLASLAFIPGVQTQFARVKLDRHPELHASLGSLTAGTGDVEAHDLTFTLGGATLALPSLQAQLPVATAVWEQKITNVRRLVAKGWTLDLTGTQQKKLTSTSTPASPGAAPATPPGSSTPARVIPALKAANVFPKILTALELPRDVTIDDVDVEGDVLIAPESGTEPVSVHVILKGGSIAAGRDGTFAIEATIPLPDTARSSAVLNARGRLVVALGSARTVSRVELTADLAAKGRTLPEGLSASVGLAAATKTDDETYTLVLTRGGRRAAHVVAHFPNATRELSGTWEVDLRDSDVAPIFPKAAFPVLATTGDGSFKTDADFTRVQGTGRLSTAASHLGALAPSLERLGAITLNTEFELTHRGQSLQFDRLTAAVGEARPVANARSLQPFSIDERTGDLTPADSRAPWLEGSLQGLPLTWVVGSPGGLALRGAGVTGEFIVNGGTDNITLQSKAPFNAPGLTIQRENRTLGRNLDLSFPMLAEFSRESWKVKCSPLTVTSGGARLATVEATFARGSVAQQIKSMGKWDADLTALSTGTAVPALSGLPGRSASGDFSIVSDTWTIVETKLVVAGRDATHTLTGSLHVSADPTGRLTYSAPIKLKLGARGSEFTAEGTWSRPGEGGRAVINLTGDNVSLDHLERLTAPLSAAGLMSFPPNPTTPAAKAANPAGARDPAPFWGESIGRVSFDFGHLTAWGHTFVDVGGTLFADSKEIRLEGGRGTFHQDRLVRATGAVTFDAAAAFPYGVKAAATVDDVDAALLLGTPPHGREPLLRGRFSIAGTLTSKGVNLADLMDRTQEEFRFTGNGGSTRLLQASVANSLTEAPTPVKDALGTVGSVFGALLKTKANVLQAEKNPVSPNTDAVLNFTYATAEFRYDLLTFTAVREADGTVRLADVILNAPNEHLTGSGQIAFEKGRPLAARPLHLELQLGVRGHPAEFLTTADLLATEKDDQGYTRLKQPIHFGGTLEQLDSGEWLALLVKAATPPIPTQKKKSG